MTRENRESESFGPVSGRAFTTSAGGDLPESPPAKPTLATPSHFCGYNAPPPSRHAQETASPEMGELGDADVASGGKGPTSTELTPRRRVPWAQLLRRVLHLDALACPRCSTPSQRVPMIVLAFLTDPEVVGKILRHLGLPVSAPLIAPARSSGPALGFALPDEDSTSSAREEDGGRDFATPEDLIRPP